MTVPLFTIFMGELKIMVHLEGLQEPEAQMELQMQIGG